MFQMGSVFVMREVRVACLEGRSATLFVNPRP